LRRERATDQVGRSPLPCALGSHAQPPMRDRRVSVGKRKRVDARCDIEVARRAAEEWGVLSTDELIECGLNHPAILRRVRRGLLHPTYRGVYAVGHRTLPKEGLWLAAVKACGQTARLSGFSSAELCGYHESDEWRMPEVTIVGGSTRSHPGIRVHRTGELADRDWRYVRGIPVTSPARTLLDLAGRLDGAPLRSLVRRAQGTHTVNVREICEALTRLPAKDRGGWRRSSPMARPPRGPCSRTSCST
jgi:hypothetical protein